MLEVRIRVDIRVMDGRVMNALHGEQHRKTIMNIDETKLEYRVISESGLVYWVLK